MPAFGAALELARRLRAAQQQDAEHRELARVDAEALLDDLPVLDDALPGRHDAPAQPLLTQLLESAVDELVAVRNDRVAVRRLIARGHE